MEHARIFLDPMHVRKNMTKVMGNEKSNALHLYTKALYAPTKELCDTYRREYGPRQRQYLSRFPCEELYRSYAELQDLTT